MAIENNISNIELVLEENPPIGKSPLPFKESHAFIIGIKDYSHRPSLITAVNDAEKLADILEKEQGFNVHKPLINASRDDMKDFLEKTMLEKVGPEDLCL